MSNHYHKPIESEAWLDINEDTIYIRTRYYTKDVNGHIYKRGAILKIPEEILHNTPIETIHEYPHRRLDQYTEDIEFEVIPETTIGKLTS